nr:tetratricopeptide repeat protein [Adonisia turfae]
MSNLGNTYTCLESYAEAIDCQQASIEIAQEIGDSWGQAAALCNLGDTYRLSEQFVQAMDSLLHSLLIFDALGAPQVETVMVLLTQIAFTTGIETYTELLEQHLVTIEQIQGEEAISRLRKYLFEE